jgi:hypothetical protein
MIGCASGVRVPRSLSTKRRTLAYVTLNPVNPSLLARSGKNTLVEHAKATTSDADVLRHSRLLLDFDPIRPSGISSTDDERVSAIMRAREVRDYLREEGWPDMILADSGNGAHVIARTWRTRMSDGGRRAPWFI